MGTGNAFSLIKMRRAHYLICDTTLTFASRTINRKTANKTIYKISEKFPHVLYTAVIKENVKRV